MKNRIRITLNTKALSVNKCWQGKRYKTKDYQSYEEELTALIYSKRYPKGVFKGKVVVDIIFYLKNASRTDIDNCVKPLIDILVKNNIIPDDRKIWGMTLEKIKSLEDKIEVIISNYQNYD